MIKGLWAGLLGLAVLTAAVPMHAQELGTIRLGVLKFGTVNWELDVIQHHGLDRAEDFVLEVQAYGGDQATSVALQGGAVDAIVDDWLWVSRQRAEGQDLVYALPYSSTVGALMVPPDSEIEALTDLGGKRLGIAGGPLDKSWFLLQGLAAQRDGMDLASEAEPVFGAPPLLQEKLISGELDAVLTYWHYAARLESRGFERLVGIEAAIGELGVAGEVPQLGYVMWEDWADEHAELVQAFGRASRAAKTILLESDQEWQRLQPMVQAEDDATLATLRERYREGIPTGWSEEERARIAALYDVLAELGGEQLVGKAPHLAEGTFWSGVVY